MVYKCCLVPTCGNNTIKTRNKIFLTVPDDERRQKWCSAIESLTTKTVYCPPKSRFYVCEDHFNLEIDCENWIQYKLMGKRIFLKKDVVPHILPSSNLTSQISSSEKKRKLKNLQETSKTPYKKFKTSHVRNLFESEHEPKSSANIEVSSPSGTFHVGPVTRTLDCGVQFAPNTKSMAIQCKLEISSANVNIKDRIISKLKTRRQNPVSEYSTNGNSSFSSVAGSMYLPTTTEEDTSESGVSRQKICNVEKENPQFYLGLPKIMYNIIDLLQKKTQCSSLHILMTLKKIRTGDTFKRIGLEFGFSRGHVSKLFKKTLPKIAFLLKQLIVWPEKKLIQKHLPIQFRYRYKNVQSIIDCYEIEIEKPSDVSLQSLTWSQYKNANTMKYLISSTPDGLINFVSRGYSGRISDTALVQDSGYLQIVPAGSSVLADRGFKEIASLLREKDCILLRPPSVNAGEKLSKNLVRESKRIASCRVHIERLIRRVREFNSARLHACVDIKNVYMLDDIMYVICGLVNLQKKLTKY